MITAYPIPYPCLTPPPPVMATPRRFGINYATVGTTSSNYTTVETAYTTVEITTLPSELTTLPLELTTPPSELTTLSLRVSPSLRLPFDCNVVSYNLTR